MTEFESDQIEGIARPAVTDGGQSNYDLDTLDAIIEENLWQAARDGLDEDAVADLLLRHRDGVMCNDLADHVGFEREIATDGGFSRRQFLGAAAALPGLPVSTAGVAADGGSNDTGGSDGDGGPDYGHSTVVKTSGGLEVWSEGNHETKVRVSSHPEGIGLKLSNEMGQMSVLLLPEDIEPLCRELLDAKAKTQPEEVEYSREWITEVFRDGDADD